MSDRLGNVKYQQISGGFAIQFRRSILAVGVKDCQRTGNFCVFGLDTFDKLPCVILRQRVRAKGLSHALLFVNKPRLGNLRSLERRAYLIRAKVNQRLRVEPGQYTTAGI